jgi:hypothetical protein
MVSKINKFAALAIACSAHHINWENGIYAEKKSFKNIYIYALISMHITVVYY